MPCYFPLHGYRARTVNDSGKRSVVFNVKDGYRDLPVTIACGQCIGCRLDRSAQWATRLTHEAQLHEKKCFLTLTYEDSQVPQGGTLVKRDFQNFMKRLRKNCTSRIRFFHCGEYGETTRRPHYHAIIYGLDFSEDRKPRASTAQGHTLYDSEKLTYLWGHGHAWIGNVTPESTAYVARYCLKKINGERAEAHYRTVDPRTGEITQLLPEYITFSKSLGLKWFKKYTSDVFPRDEVILAGKRRKTPRAYDNQLEKDNPKLLSKIKHRRRARASRNKYDNSPSRLATRHEAKQLYAQQTMKRKFL